MEAGLVSRATAAATSLADTVRLQVDDVIVIHNSNKLALRLLPCDVFARVALVGHEVAALEVQLARRLSAMGSPVAALEPRVEPRVYERDGFAVTWWTYYEVVTPAQDSPAEYAAALDRLHADLRGVEVAAPHVMEGVAQGRPSPARRVSAVVLAMVVAWRWDVRDDFPDGTQHGRDILALLREGPPWPVVGSLDSG